MPTDAQDTRRRWLWFVLMWAAGVALFGAVVFVLRAVMGWMLGA